MAEENNWEEVVNEVTTNSKETYNRSMQIAATRNPEEHAAVINTARKLDIPSAVITPNNFAEAKVKASEMENRFELLADIAPRTTKWLSHPDNSSLAKDDVKNLQGIEEMVHEHSFGENFANTLGSGMAGMNAMLMRVPDAIIAVGQYPMNKAIQIFDLPYRQSNPTDIWENSGAKHYEDNARALAAQSDWLNINTEKAIADGDAKKIGTYLAAQVLANAPNQVINLLAAYSGVGIPALVMNGVGVAGQSIAESGERGVSPTTALEAGALKGATEALFESLGTLGLFKKWEGAIHKSLGSGSMKEIAAAVGKTLLHSVGGEANEEFLTSIMQDFSDYATGNKPEALDGMLGRALESGAVGGISGGLMTAPMSFLAASQRHAQNMKSEKDRDHFLKLEEKVLESKLQVRDGQSMSTFVGEATKGSASENVYIDPRVLTEYLEKKDISPAEVMKGMGMIEKWNAAKESGSAMEIPTALLLSKLAGTEHWKALANDIKFSPDGMSVNESKISAEDEKQAEDQQRAAMAEQAYQQDEDSKQNFNKKRAEIREGIRKDISDQMVATGRYTAEEAHANSIIHEKFFATLEETYGIDAEHLFQEFGPQIIAGDFVLPNEESMDKSIIDRVKEIVGPKAMTSEDRAKTEEAIQIARAEKDAAFEQRIQAEMDAGLDVKYDKKKQIIPQLTVLYQIRSDIEIGNSESIMILKREGGDESKQVISESSTTVPAPKYVLHYKNNATYKNLKTKINRIIEKVEANKPLGKNDYKFLDGIYEGGVNAIKHEIGRSDANMIAQKVVSDSKAQSGYKEFSDDDPFTLFETDKKIQGSYTPEKRLIKIAESKTMATFLHESGHYFFDVIEKIVNTGQAPQGLMDDYMKIREYVGAQEGKVLTVEQHEKFADAFVNYLGTGKAPSKGLRRAFQTFKNWLFTVYNGLRLNPHLSPEIVGVFDRMLASKQEIQDQIDELTPVDYGIGFEADVMNRYNKLKPELQMEAEDKLTEIELERENKKLSKEYKAREAEIKASFEAQSDAMPVFKVIDQIKNDEYVDKINRADVEAMRQKFAANFPQSLVKTNGSSAEILATVNGYANAAEMLKDIAERKDRDQWVKEQTNAEMARLYPDLQPKLDLSEDAKKAVHTEAREKRLIMEMDMLAERAFPVVKGIARKLIERTPRRAVIKSAAVMAVGAKQVADIKPHIHRQAEVKFAKEAAKAFVKGDFQAAFEAKKMEYYNFELYNASIAANEKIEKSKKLYKILRRSDDQLAKKREMNYINVARAILKMYGIGPAKKSVADYLEALSNYDKESYESLSLLVAPVQEAAKPVGEATYAEFLAMDDMVQSLWEMAGEAKKMTVGGEEMLVDDVAKKLAPQFMALTEQSAKKRLTPAERDALAKLTKNINAKASYRRFESWCNGITTGGQKVTLTDAFNILFRPISEADTKYRSKINEYNKILQEIVNKNNAWFQEAKEFNSDELDYIFSKPEMFMAILHSGNESNLRKLIVGRGWGKIDENGVLDRSKFDAAMARARSEGYLNADVYKMAQEIWDMNESLNPDTQKAHKKVKGFYFGKVTNTPFTNEFGTFKGGYVPAKVDPMLVRDAKQRQRVTEMAEKSGSYAYPSKAMDNGFANDRNENYFGPLSLDFHLVPNHLSEVIKFTYMEPARKQMFNLLKNNELYSAIAAFDPEAIPHIIETFLDRAKEQKVIVPSGNKSADKKQFMEHSSFVRNTVTIQVMTGLATSAMQQYTGLVVAKTKFLGDQQGHLSDSIGRYFFKSEKQKMIDFAAEKSAWFKTELVNNNFELSKEIEDIIFNKTKMQKAQEFAKKHAYFLQKAAQNQVSTIVWHAAYNQFYERSPNGKDTDAVQYADSMVRTTQGTNNPIDVAQSQVVDPFESLFYQFTGYFNMVYNAKQETYERIEREVGLDGNKTDPSDVRIRKMVVYMTASAIPAMIVGQLLRTMAGRPFDADGDGKIGLLDLLNALLPMVAAEVSMLPTHPLVKQGVMVAINRFNKLPMDDRMTSPAFSMIERAAGAPADIVQGKRRAGVTDVMTLIGMATQLPVAPLAKPINYVADVSSGKAKPTGPIDFTRGLLTGTPGKK